MPRQWTPDDVLKLASSYQQACVLVAAADLDLFSVLAGRSLKANAIAKELAADPRAAAILLDALAAMDLLDKQGDAYSVPPGVADVLTTGGMTSKLAMAQHQGNCLRRWAQLARAVKQGAPAERGTSIRGEQADQAAFIEAMDNISGPAAAPLVASLQGLTFTHLLDIGGASGTYTIAMLRAVPRAKATLFDLPAVIPFARSRIDMAGLADRVSFAPGDFYNDPLPAGADFAWVSAIIHQNSPAQNRDLYAKVHQALAPGGTIAIRDIVMDATRTRPAMGALFAINMLTATPAGGTYTFDEIRGDLEATGFTDVTFWRQGDGMDSVVRATKRITP